MTEIEKKKLHLLKLQYELKEIALPIGSMHPFWDVIIDIQCFLEGKPTIVQLSIEEWIEHAEKLLGRNNSNTHGRML